MYRVINENKIKLFEVAIIFFSNYAKQNFKANSYKLNWYKIFNFFINNGTYDSYEEYTNLYKMIESDKKCDEKILQKKAYDFFYALINNGEKISDLFIFFDDNDRKILEEKEKEIKYVEQKNRFDKIKCFKCIHFIDNISCIDNSTYELNIENIMKEYKSIDEVRKNFLIKHQYNCKKRESIIKELMRFDTYPFEKEKRTNKKLEDSNEPENFKYEIDENGKVHQWHLRLVPSNKECKYFQDSNITFEEFIKKYYEILK